MLLHLNKITVPPGSQLLLRDLTWDDFKRIIDELGERRSSRLSYSKGTLEIMTPLPEHESGKKIIGDLVSALLDELGIEFWPLGSINIKKQSMNAAVEPDECYYIANEAVVRGRDRLDFEMRDCRKNYSPGNSLVDPPPDLAIEIDITSRTAFDNYQALGVPELWKYNGKTLQISILRTGTYTQSQTSDIFPNLNVADIIPNLLALSKKEGRSRAIQQMRVIALEARI